MKFSPRYILKEPKTEKETLIYLIVRGEYKYIKYSLSETIKPIFWDKKTQRPIKPDVKKMSPLLIKRTQNLSMRIDEIDLYVNNLILDLSREKSLALENIKKSLDIYFGRVKEPVKMGVIDYCNDIIDRMESGKILSNKGTLIGKGTLSTYKSYIEMLKQYQVYKKKTIQFDDIDKSFYDNYLVYCNIRKYKINTVGRAFSVIKNFLNIALDEGAHQNNFQNSSKFKISNQEVDSISLNQEELNRMYNLDLSDSPHLQTARDVFLIGAYTALRFSDYSKIRKDHIKITRNEVKVIDLTNQKTRTRVIIPFLFDNLDPILKKYDYNIPPITMYKLNDSIKEVGKLANIDQNIIINETIGGLRRERVEKKYNLISSHTARRSGATNMYHLGYPLLSISKITGHKSIKTLMKYIKIDDEENAEMMMIKKNNKDRGDE